MNFPVFDLHCDTALELLNPENAANGGLLRNRLHIDLERAAQLDGYCQCFACFTTPDMEQWMHKKPVDVFEQELSMIVGQMQMHSDRIRQVFSAEEAENNRKNGILSGILTIEGPAGFGFDPEMLEMLGRIGFRISTLGWNERNCLIGSHMTGGGLTDLGRVYVREAQRCGILVDVSHCSDEGFWDIVKVTQKPILASHSNSRAVCDHSRNLTDDMFRAIVETGGVAGLNQCAAFVGEDPTLDTLCEHVLHWLELDPEGEHIALGGDLDGCHHLPAGFDGVQSYPALAQKLLQHGAGEAIVRNIFWNNAMEVFSHAVPIG